MYRAYLEVTVRDRTGKVVRRIRRESKSFVKNFMNILHSLFTGADISIVDTYGTSRTIPYAFKDVDNYLTETTVLAPEGNDLIGILVGSGTTPPTPDDYSLESKIPHGDGDNQLHYYDVVVSNVLISGNEMAIEIERSFDNNGTVDVTVREVGLVLEIDYKSGGVYDSAFVLILRDVLDSPVTVLAGGSLTVKYTIKCVT